MGVCFADMLARASKERERCLAKLDVEVNAFATGRKEGQGYWDLPALITVLVELNYEIAYLDGVISNEMRHKQADTQKEVSE